MLFARSVVWQQALGIISPQLRDVTDRVQHAHLARCLRRCMPTVTLRCVSSRLLGAALGRIATESLCIGFVSLMKLCVPFCRSLRRWRSGMATRRRPLR